MSAAILCPADVMSKASTCGKNIEHVTSQLFFLLFASKARTNMAAPLGIQIRSKMLLLLYKY